MCAKLAKGDVGLRALAWAGLALIDPLQTKVRDGAGREHVTGVESKFCQWQICRLSEVGSGRPSIVCVAVCWASSRKNAFCHHSSTLLRGVGGPFGLRHPCSPGAGSRAIFSGDAFFLIQGSFAQYTFQAVIPDAPDNQPTLPGLNAGAQASPCRH